MKKIRNNLTVLERQLNELFETHAVIVPTVAMPYLRSAMKSFAVQAIRENKRKHRQDMIAILKAMPKLFRIGYAYFLKLWIRKQFLHAAIRTAKLRAETSGFKQYVILSGEFTYKIVSSQDFRVGKKLKVFKKELTFLDMQKAACKVIRPSQVVLHSRKIEKIGNTR